jgi:membrane-bound metal-dependent hydrolase YbcI (DUF457 family)
VLRRRSGRSDFSPVRVYSDPFQHAAIAAAVVAPLTLGAPRRVLVTAVAAAVVIDLDHVIAARSALPGATTGLDQRPRSHSLLTAVLAGALVAARAGPAHGWATFAALGSHLLHDAGDTAAPTPVLWPFRPARQLGRRYQLAGTLLLTTASAAVGYAASRARVRAAAYAADGPSGPARRTTSSRS